MMFGRLDLKRQQVFMVRVDLIKEAMDERVEEFQCREVVETETKNKEVGGDREGGDLNEGWKERGGGVYS